MGIAFSFAAVHIRQNFFTAVRFQECPESLILGIFVWHLLH